MSTSTNHNVSQSLTLTDLPLEILGHVFQHLAADRDIRPRDVLRYWFEKKDVHERIAQAQSDDPDTNINFVPGYNHQYDEDSELEVDDGASDDENDSEDEDENDEDDNEDEEDGDGDNDEEDQEDEQEHDLVEDGGDEANEPEENELGHASNQAQDGEEQDAMVTSPQDEALLEVTETNILDAPDGNTEDGQTAQDVATVAPECRVIAPAAKWRHVPKFMKITLTPPPANLFLISRTINAMAKAWFYDVAVLRIDATAGFLHFTFFEIVLNQLADAAFSPMENIRKADITFVWDTTWIRSEPTGFAQAVFPAFLHKRVEFIVKILSQAPELQQVAIHWHDSAQDQEAKCLKEETLSKFVVTLKSSIEVIEHYIAPETKPFAKSRAGRQRLDFQAVLDNGGDTM